jgi:hypothetical protein
MKETLTLLERLQREAREYLLAENVDATAHSINQAIANTLKQAAEALDVLTKNNEASDDCKTGEHWATHGYPKGITDAQKILLGKDTCPDDCDGQKIYTKCPLHGESNN